MAASPKYGNAYVPADTNTIAGPVRVSGMLFTGGAAGGTVTVSIASDQICSITLAANQVEHVPCPLAVDSGVNIVIGLTGNAKVVLLED